MIEVKDLTKRYGSRLAVDHLSFRVKKGCIYGFLGPNGAGKSTTMNMMTGYLASTEGQIIVDGHDMFEEPEAAKKSIGYLPEVPPLYPDMTVREYLQFVAELKKVPKADREEQIEEIMEKTCITEMEDRLIKHLSKGYKQRVGFAQALIGYPPVLILDEPMAGLDPKQITEIRDLIRELKKNHTIFLSSHILSEVSSVCDHVLILSHGKLMASDTPENLSRQLTGQGQQELVVKGSQQDIEKAMKLLEQLPDLEVHQNAASLEDIFLELTSDRAQDETEEEETAESETEQEEEGQSHESDL
ncbi:MAG: ABC transporter ATP-binding protein [Lachnospiraceae bacterium]|nr:ABC transporter ATP-binding protein [Lachnospiraceae bacterium]